MKDEVIAGALFDFMGWLTSRKKRIVLSSVDEASPAVDAIKDFAKMRGLSLDNAQVQTWQEALAQPEQEPVAWMTINGYGEEDDIHYENPKGNLMEGWTYKPLYTHPPQPAPVQEPVAWMEMVVANLVREGVNKHKARELAQHFYTPPHRTP